jgi:hypothetical protein
MDGAEAWGESCSLGPQAGVADVHGSLQKRCACLPVAIEEALFSRDSPNEGSRGNGDEARPYYAGR